MAFNSCGRFRVTSTTPRELLLFSMINYAMVTVFSVVQWMGLRLQLGFSNSR